MVKFDKLLDKGKITIPVDPIEIFDNLDKEIGKEYLRLSQKAVLEEWYRNYQTQKDIIVKLHTGQGKTLIGLLILQSSINEEKGPAIYICPNNYLVNQTMEQARSFGIKTISVAPRQPLPYEFLNSEVILVANCNKLFNGMSVFGIGRSKIDLGAIVIDDAHNCLDIIRESFSITVNRKNEDGNNNPIYTRLWALFEDSLKRQAPGTCIDISHGERCQMAVPFWTWFDKRDELLEVLSEYKESNELKFTWNLIKDNLIECVCIFSGNRLEITPWLLPIDLIPSYSNASRRIFLSATLTEDAFLLKDMGILSDSITNPLSLGDVQYSGERLILLPSLVDINLQRRELISWIQTLATKHGDFGVVAITQSNYRANDWRSGGAEITSVRNLYERIDDLKIKIKKKEAKNVLVLVNQYDGIDLPDNTCRILSLDLLPSYNTLVDEYLLEMRPFSGIIRRHRAQMVEQGMGRAIRGFSDWCIVVIIGNNITHFLSEKMKRAFLSNEAQLQIKIGEILAKEMRKDGGQLGVIEDLIDQCLGRDESWKQYYKVSMSELEPDEPQKIYLEYSIYERDAELLFRQGQYRLAAESIQNILESVDQVDKGWFLQLMAKYLYPLDRTRSMDIQIKAHMENPRLFRPPAGVTYSKLTLTGTRTSRIFEWIKEHNSYNSVILEVREITGTLLWGSASKSFERGIYRLGIILGFISDRPEMKTGEGPDNHWHIQGKLHWIIECKNQAYIDRKDIAKKDSGQLSNSIGWFEDKYEAEEGVPIIIHPATELATGAYITEPFWVMGIDELGKLRENTTSFFNSLIGTPFDSLSPKIIGEKLIENNLDTSDLMREYLKRGK